MIGVIGIILSLALLMYFAYKGISVLILAPLLALFAALLSSIGGQGIPLMATLTEVFMKSLAGYVKAYFPIFLLGAIFGKVMDESGAARAISHTIAKKLGKDKAIIAVVLSCAILTYGGVSLFVVAFAVYPIAVALFKEADIPKRLIPGSIALGAFTFTMTALPGTPQIQNAIPMPFFGTDAYAAPILGIMSAVVMCGGGLAWLNYRARQAKNRGEGYGNHPKDKIIEFDESELPSFSIAMIPILLVLVINFILSRSVFVAGKYNGEYLTQAPYNTSLSSVSGTWSLIIALVISIIVAIVLNYKRFKGIKKCVNDGAVGSLLAILNTASEVGYGNVIQTLAGFETIKIAILGISKNPIVSEALSVNILAGITGSASGGMSIALGALGKTYYDMAMQQGINPEVLHRIAALACGGLDTLPHNGAVITLLAICGLTHKESYLDIGMVSVIIPIAGTIIAVILAIMGVV